MPAGVLPLPSSATGRKALISMETLKLAKKVRASGAKVVLVSGTRYSTLVNRLPFLPRADAYVIENGGRIFYPRKDGDGKAAAAGGEEEEESAVGDPTLTAHAVSALTEDLKWREILEDATGSASQDAKAPEDREGPLWDLYRKAVAEGFEVDTNTYYTMIRCVPGVLFSVGGRVLLSLVLLAGPRRTQKPLLCAGCCIPIRVVCSWRQGVGGVCVCLFVWVCVGVCACVFVIYFLKFDRADRLTNETTPAWAGQTQGRFVCVR